MYREHFGLKELPFSIAPNPRHLYLTHQHQEALAHLVYGLDSAGGVILLTGEVGTGKTTISRKLLEDIPDNIVIAWIVNPRLSVEELLAAICDELSISYPAGNRSIKIFTDLINNCLLFAHGLGHNVVLMIDEAQNLSPEVLEQLRLLTNLETSERKLLQIVLLGQPELKTMLERSDLRQLAQRITARYHLHPLSRQETCGYIRHRLAVGGCSRPVFTSRAMKQIYKLSHGTPRLINLLCDRAMLGVYSSNAAMVHPKHVRQASIEVLGEVRVQKRPFMLPISIALLLIATGIVATGTWNPISNSVFPQQANQMATTPPSPAPKTAAEKPAITPADLTEPKSLPTYAPEQIEKPTPKAEFVQQTEHEPAKQATAETVMAQASESKLTEVAQIEASPVQSPEMLPATEKHAVEISQADKLAIEPTKYKTSDNMAATDKEKDNPSPPLPVSVWDNIEKSGSKTLAFQTMAKIWHSNITSTEGDPCKQLADPGMSCLKQRANIWLIRAMNRPVIFRFDGEDGASHYGLVRFISHGYAVIQLGDQQWRVKLSELKQYLQGKISIIWFKPPGYQKDIQQGDRGQTVVWLAKQLDRIQGTMIPPRQVHSMDDILVARLKDFQKSEHMTADGIAGTLTLMRINERIGLDIPLLMDGTKH